MREIKEPWILARVLTDDYCISLYDLTALASSGHGCGSEGHEWAIRESGVRVAAGLRFAVSVYFQLVPWPDPCPLVTNIAGYECRERCYYSDYESAFAVFREQELRIYEHYREMAVAD